MKPIPRFVGLALLAVLAVVVGIAWSGSKSQDKPPVPTESHCGDPKSGPLGLDVCPDGVGITDFTASPGEHHTFAFDAINLGNQAAVLHKVTLVEPTAGLSVQAFFTSDPKFDVGHSSQFPPEGFDTGIFKPLDGAIAQPAKTEAPRDSLVLAISVTGKGILGFKGVVLDYSVGQNSYQVTYPYGVKICSPKSDYLSGCTEPNP